MFSSRERLERRKGESGTDRPVYLQALVTEFQASTDPEARRQVVAHLGNFAYDPINYKWFKELNVVDLFLDAAQDGDATVARFGMQALSNVMADPEMCALALREDGADVIAAQLGAAADEETRLAAHCALAFACGAGGRDAFLRPEVLEALRVAARAPADRQLCHTARFALAMIEGAESPGSAAAEAGAAR